MKLLLLLLVVQLIQCNQKVFKQRSLIPFTYEWNNVLEGYYNMFGKSKNSTCLLPVPNFNCEPFIWNDQIINRDAYHLRPNDIKSVIAIGDSISAGFGMITNRPPLATLLEYRGKVFSIGGDKGEYTIPNFISIYHNISKGSSKGSTLPLSKGKQLNNAVSGSKTQDLNEQVSRLLNNLNSNEYKDVKDEWKLITIFIGANNLCLLCEPPMTTLPSLANADIFEDNLRQVLERLNNQVGKSFVNLVALFNVSSVYEASRGDPYCEMILDPNHLAICSCIQGDERQRQAADRLIYEYNLRLKKLEKEFKLKDIKNFGISYQPSFEQFPIAKYKQAYFSDIDCFHPNKCANQVMATLLWNNMFSNEKEKRKIVDFENLEFKCPSSRNPYIQ